MIHQTILVLALLVSMSQGQEAQAYVPAQLTSENTVTAVGSADLSVEPDMANITLTVTASGKTVADAQAENAQKSKILLDTFRTKFGLAKSDYRNSLSESKDTDYVNNKTVVKGEIVRNTITIKTRQLDLIGAMIDAAGGAGAETSYVSYGLSDPQSFKEKALQKAALNAQANAAALLKAYNLTLGTAVAIVQSGASASVVRADAPQARAMAMSAPATPTEVNSGQITVSASVTVVFLIK